MSYIIFFVNSEQEGPIYIIDVTGKWDNIIYLFVWKMAIPIIIQRVRICLTIIKTRSHIRFGTLATCWAFSKPISTGLFDGRGIGFGIGEVCMLHVACAV